MDAGTLTDSSAARDAWLAARRTGIGSTDAAVIAGATKWKSPLQLYAEKIGEMPESAEETEAQRWGKLLEPLIAAEYERETSRHVFDPGPYTIQRSPDRPWLISTIDRFVTRRPDEALDGAPLSVGAGVLELKTGSAYSRDDWANGPPVLYQVQVQHQLAVTGHQWGSIAVLIGGQSFLWIDVARDEKFIDALLAQEEEFYWRIQHRKPPPPDGSRSSRAAVHALYPFALIDDVVKLDADALTWDSEREASKRAIKHHEQLIDKYDNLLRMAIGPHGGGVLPNGVCYLWRNEKRAGYTVKPTEPRVLRRKELK